MVDHRVKYHYYSFIKNSDQIHPKFMIFVRRTFLREFLPLVNGF